MSEFVPPLRRTATELAYLLVSFPLALFGFLYAFLLFYTGVILAWTFLGLLLIAAAVVGARSVAGLSQRLAGRLLGVRLEPLAPLRASPGRVAKIKAALTDVAGWRALAYLLAKFASTFVTFLVAGGCWAYGLRWLTYPAWRPSLGVNLGEDGRPHHGMQLWHGAFLDRPWQLVLVCLVGAALLLLAPRATHAGVLLDRWLMVTLLTPRDGDERVQALEQSRAQVVNDTAATVRRIERDLHDGAQARLIAVSLTLGQAADELAQVDDAMPRISQARELVGSAQVSTHAALGELRDLVRGIHPPALDEGLEAALALLAEVSTVPVEFVADLPCRPSPAIETIAYFCASELLANVARHSGAQHGRLELTQPHGTGVRMRVTDDGCGGARLAEGSGLPGLRDRVRAVDGSLSIDSPTGGPSMITVELPGHA
ncbi:MAG: sensor domain-containing protein [Nocardioides sp.]|uniref:sensor histidine kinase n=1 Tax=Nocardioides sp. TaxID=35761 RepID=UPI0032664907